MTQVPGAEKEGNTAFDHKPQNIEEYKQWVKTSLNFEYDAQGENQYKYNVLNARDIISQNPFVTNLDKELLKWDAEYNASTQSELFMAPPSLKLDTKPYSSTIDKSFRINILWNKSFPTPPKYGWVTSSNIYSQLNDLVRTCLVCKFIDGPGFLIGKLREYAKAHMQECKAYPQSREGGYYAYHFYTYFEIPVMNPAWMAVTAKMSLEIQVTTQLQDVLRDLTHQYFELSRIDPHANDEKWKWEIDTDRFRTAYMSHTLHLLEAIIIDLRKASISSKLHEKEGEKHETKSP